VPRERIMWEGKKGTLEKLKKRGKIWRQMGDKRRATGGLIY
jgi:hypothetical protein